MKKNTLFLTGMPALLAFALALTGCGQGAAGASQAEQVMREAISGEITVSAYESMTYKTFLEEAARRFQEQYPGTTVHVETFEAMPVIQTVENDDGSVSGVAAMTDDPQSRRDYISRVNTALMSGKGADLYALDILPLQKYAESGLFENLDHYITADPSFDKSAYQGSVIDASYYAGGLYFMPMEYRFNYYVYDSTLLPQAVTAAFGPGARFTSGALLELAKPYFRASGPKVFSSYASFYVMTTQRIEEYYPQFVNIADKTAHFTTEFVNLINETQAWGEAGYLPRNPWEQMSELVTGDDTMTPFDFNQESTDRFFFKVKGNDALLSYFLRGLSPLGMWSFGGGANGIEADDQIAGMQAAANGIVPYKYQRAYGLSANSKNKRTAWAFITFLMSEEMQLVEVRSDVLSINNAVRAQNVEQSFQGFFWNQEQGLTDAQRAVLTQYQQTLDALSAQISGYVLHDSVVDEMMWTELDYYLSGERTLDEVARTLQSKVELYLNE
jgi:multiple sugar transport system substrate-binding protein